MCCPCDVCVAEGVSILYSNGPAPPSIENYFVKQSKYSFIRPCEPTMPVTAFSLVRLNAHGSSLSSPPQSVATCGAPRPRPQVHCLHTYHRSSSQESAISSPSPPTSTPHSLRSCAAYQHTLQGHVLRYAIPLLVSLFSHLILTLPPSHISSRLKITDPVSQRRVAVSAGAPTSSHPT